MSSRQRWRIERSVLGGNSRSSNAKRSAARRGQPRGYFHCFSNRVIRRWHDGSCRVRLHKLHPTTLKNEKDGPRCGPYKMRLASSRKAIQYRRPPRRDECICSLSYDVRKVTRASPFPSAASLAYATCHAIIRFLFFVGGVLFMFAIMSERNDRGVGGALDGPCDRDFEFTVIFPGSQLPRGN